VASRSFVDLQKGSISEIIEIKNGYDRLNVRVTYIAKRTGLYLPYCVDEVRQCCTYNLQITSTLIFLNINLAIMGNDVMHNPRIFVKHEIHLQTHVPIAHHSIVD
jgi:hypothetical protein